MEICLKIISKLVPRHAAKIKLLDVFAGDQINTRTRLNTAARDEGILIYFLITDCKKLRMYCDPHTRLTGIFVPEKCT